MGTLRTGDLTEESLVGAVLAEREEGRRPGKLAVGSRLLEVRALAVLGPNEATPFDDLRGIVPNVVVDPLLPDDGWELREA
jgi:hypothetical protein